MKKPILSLSLLALCTLNAFAVSTMQPISLYKKSGFFRISAEKIRMPEQSQDMGFIGLNYFIHFTPSIYGGLGGYGAISGTEGGLFVLGFAGGMHQQFYPHWWSDAGLYVGGGGGHAALVGGGLMLRPHIGIQYDFTWARLGIHYSYLTFPSGKIHSHQIGLDIDIPYDFHYVPENCISNKLLSFKDIQLFDGKNLAFQRNDVALFLQTYHQPSGTRDNSGNIQDGTVGLMGAELNHYFTKKIFWFVKASGAFRGIYNGYMDILGGMGLHQNILSSHFAIVPQFGMGAGGGGKVSTGGGALIQPSLGVEHPITSKLSGRISGGYLFAPDGDFKAYTLTGTLLYHLDLATEDGEATNLSSAITSQSWRIGLLNQTYVHPQRSWSTPSSSIQLIAVQIDQMLSQNIFLSYQAASAYSGKNAGGLASGMIGGGLQSSEILHTPLQIFSEILLGAAGGGGLALAGGAVVEPVVGLHYQLTDAIGLQASAGQLKALNHDLNTPVLNVGVTVRFGTLSQ